MVEVTLAIRNELGLHARAAARLVRTANLFQSDLRLERIDGSASADAKSILNVLMLAASGGTELRAIAEGKDEAAALAALAGLFEDGFGELKQ
jgi:phosphocarrier protein HPr